MKQNEYLTTSYKKWARSLAIAWTLLIFIACLIPGKELPDVNIPLVDKWVHFVLFAVFTFLWHCTHPVPDKRFFFILFVTTVFIGWLVEYVQGHYVQGRTQDNWDTLMDAIGGIIGSLIFTVSRTILFQTAKTSAPLLLS